MHLSTYDDCTGDWIHKKKPFSGPFGPQLAMDILCADNKGEATKSGDGYAQPVGPLGFKAYDDKLVIVAGWSAGRGLNLMVFIASEKKLSDEELDEIVDKECEAYDDIRGDGDDDDEDDDE